MTRAPAGPVVHLHCLCWNEAAIIPHFLRHYDGLVSRFFVHDNGSTDGSVALLQADPRVTLASFAVTGDSFALEEQRRSDRMWQCSRGRADWVIVVDMDEFLFHPDLPAYLRCCRTKGISAIRAIGYDMIADDMPAGGPPLHQVVTRGVRSLGYDKPCIFDPQAIAETRFSIGRHGATPAGRVVWPERPQVALLHFKYMGAEYSDTRNRVLRGGLKPRDHEMGWGGGYLRSAAQTGAHHRRLREAAAPVPGLPGGPPAETLGAEEATIRASARFDAAWYLARNPDVARNGYDPAAHYGCFGWLEGRLPNPGFSPADYLRYVELDAAWYLARYPDVQAAGLDAATHFVQHGWREGRRANPQVGPADYFRSAAAPR